MLVIKPSTAFKKDLKRIQKSGRKQEDIQKIQEVIKALAIPAVLPERNKDHSLGGNYQDYRECHILPDLLLIYRQVEETSELYLYRIGTHSELF